MRFENIRFPAIFEKTYEYIDNEKKLPLEKDVYYVYDSAHFFYKLYGSFNTIFNKDVYFRFSNGILVENQVLNNIIGVRLVKDLNSLSELIQEVIIYIDKRLENL